MVKRILLHTLAILGLLALFYALSAYEFVPSVWGVVERRHPAMQAAGTRAFTANGIPGDPLNLAFVGSEDELLGLMSASHWVPADPITFKTSMRIAVSSVAHRPYADAPVSNLYVRGQRQDLAFEAPSGPDPSKRHHVRFWKMPGTDLLGRPLWVGAATYDRGVGLSHTTGQVTHHIAPNVDSERDKFLADIANKPGVQVHWIDNFQTDHAGRNGGGDPYVTDGRLAQFELNPAR